MEYNNLNLKFIEYKKLEKLCQYYRSWLDNNTVPIVMDKVKCDDDDMDISDCSATLMSHDCDHSEDIWLHCKGK